MRGRGSARDLSNPAHESRLDDLFRQQRVTCKQLVRDPHDFNAARAQVHAACARDIAWPGCFYGEWNCLSHMIRTAVWLRLDINLGVRIEARK